MIVWPVKITECKYSRWYNELIEKGKNRVYPENEYGETHHIIPRSFGGSNDKENLVRLSAREHYIAHALLWRMKFTNEYATKMAYAFCTFMYGFKFKEHTEKYKISSRMYETFKKQYSILQSKEMSGKGNPFYGKIHNEETKKIIGEKSKLKVFKRGPENPNWGKKVNLTPEQKQKRSENSKAIWNSPGYRERHSESRKQFLESPLGQQRRKENGDRLRGVKRDPAIVEKSASKRRGRKGTELFSEQALANMREGIKNRVLTDAGREKIRETTRATGKRPKSEEHKRKISESNKGKQGLVVKSNPMYCKTHSEETKRKIAETKLRRKLEKLAQNDNPLFVFH